MFLWILQNIIVSILVILLFHYLYNYIIINFTKQKTIDLIQQPNKKYDEILQHINRDNTIPINTDSPKEKNDESVSTNMVDELQSFLNTQIQIQKNS